MNEAAAAIFLCAGRGTRMRGTVADKVLAPLGDQPVFAHSVRAFLEAAVASTFVFVFRSLSQKKHLSKTLDGLSKRASLRILWVRGGSERQHSVAAALEALPATITTVFIHDCARPFIRAAQLRKLSSLARRHGSAILAHRVTDTIKRTPPATEPATPSALKTLDRAHLWAAETPQVFRRKEIAHAYSQIAAANRRITDDAQAAELAGLPVCLLENLEPNPKITTPGDLAYAAFLLTQRSQRERLLK